MVQIVLELLNHLGTEKAYLNDGTTVTCSDAEDIDLTLYKLLEKSEPFYTKFGFEFYIEPGTSPNMLKFFKDAATTSTVLNKALNEIRKLKLSDLKQIYSTIIDICSNAIKNNDESSIIVHKFNNGNIIPPDSFVPESKVDVVYLITKSKSILSIVDSSDLETFHELVVQLVSKNLCLLYQELLFDLFDNQIHKITYHDLVLSMEYTRTFALFRYIRNNVVYVYRFKK